MTTLSRIHRMLGGLLAGTDRAIAMAACLALAAIVVANAVEIALRATLNQSISWLYEVNLLLGNWIYFLGICLVYYRNSDIVVDFVIRHGPKAMRRPYQLLLHLTSVSVLLVIVWQGARLMALQAPDYTMGVGIWNPLYTLPVVLGGAVMIVIIVHQSITVWLGEDLPGATHTVDPV